MNWCKRYLIMVALVCCLLLGGCGDRQELSDTDIILGVGLDTVGDGMKLTVELFSAGEQEPCLLTVQGCCLEQAVPKLYQRLEGQPFWGAGAVIIYGPGCSWQQAQSFGGWLYQQLRLPGRTLVLRAESSEAATVLAGSLGQAKSTALGLAEGLRLAVKDGVEPLYLYQQLQNDGWGSMPRVSCRQEQVVLEVKNGSGR